MKKVILIGLASVCLTGPAWAKIEIIEAAGEPFFEHGVEAHLKAFAAWPDPLIQRLYKAVAESRKTVWIGPVTKDPATRHVSGSPTRWNTKDLDDDNVALYIPARDLGVGNKKLDVLIHEFVHAYDRVAFKHKNPSGEIRERRAVFFQNVFRDRAGKKLRNDYRGRFATEEYQKARSEHRVGEAAKYLFEHNDLP